MSKLEIYFFLLLFKDGQFTASQCVGIWVAVGPYASFTMQPSDQTKMLTKPRVIKKPRFKNFIITTMKVFYENCLHNISFATL